MTGQIGQKAPEFSIPVSETESKNLTDYKGRYLILYFYPKDDTSGCTTQAVTFTEHKAEFDALGCDILGVSRDSLAKHEKFKTKHDLGIELGSDETGDVTEAYGVWVEKKMYGKTYMGIERSTFLIAPDGKIVNIWRKVRVKGHVENVLATLKDETSAT